MMTARVKVKICGLTDPASAEWAAQCGAHYLGVVFFTNSPRAVSTLRAAEIFEFVGSKVERVGLFVDPTDQQLDQVMNNVRLDILQLHGSESAERVEQIRLEYGMKVIKALGIKSSADLDAAQAYDNVADYLLFDAKPPADSSRPGGLGQAFDWTLLKGRKWSSPWFLAGGLTSENVAAAIFESGAKLVDVSTGVEASPGIKDPDKIELFIAQAKGKKSDV
jgi:phosphoribosylanthranilate isomerase